MDPELTGANVMLVNKPRAGHPGTTQEQTRPAGRASVHPKPGRRIRKPNSVTRCAMCYSLCGGDRDEPGSPLAAPAAAAPAAAARTPSTGAHPGTPERGAAAGPVRPGAP
ncbi:uncharacterized protein LOC111176388 [Delphinapterus leucas]|uniref:Uncharacterized protein LOC111176388 n=1 Tax=Delphinapterus leucas TaxID=9749 RepID=A0A2Y9NEH2_DELLE|nr:uncharacterized protein LOC111176388 [Delphinapterus leucas]